MGSKATTVDEQIELLRSRGMIIADTEKAKEVLLDIGYYRLGFYWFPFEKPCSKNQMRVHEFKEKTNFNDVVKLYYFDYDIRNLLHKYISRIEVNFRTYLVYLVSNDYPEDPTWFVNQTIVEEKYISNFNREVYTTKFKRNKFIAKHHHLHREDSYAPAWKTIEFMTLGSNIALYKSIKNINLKKKIANHFGIKYTNVFENYIDVVRCVRNTCAHGGVLYDIALHPLIRKGPAGVKSEEGKNLYGALKVVHYLLNQISKNRSRDFDKELFALLKKYMSKDILCSILTQVSGFQSFKRKKRMKNFFYFRKGSIFAL